MGPLDKARDVSLELFGESILTWFHNDYKIWQCHWIAHCLYSGIDEGSSSGYCPNVCKYGDVSPIEDGHEHIQYQLMEESLAIHARQTLVAINACKQCGSHCFWSISEYRRNTSEKPLEVKLYYPSQFDRVL
jgi:hypothetical protein